MSALQQTHGFPPTLTILETRGTGQRRVFAQAPFHSCQGNPGRPQPKWLSGGASEPSSHGEKEGGSLGSCWPSPQRSCVSIFLSKKMLWTADNTRRYETASSPTCCT